MEFIYTCVCNHVHCFPELERMFYENITNCLLSCSVILCILWVFFFFFWQLLSLMEVREWAGWILGLIFKFRIHAGFALSSKRYWDAIKKRESKMSGLLLGKSCCHTPTVFSILLSALEMDISLPLTHKTTISLYITGVWTWKFKWVAVRSNFSGFKLKGKDCSL